MSVCPSSYTRRVKDSVVGSAIALGHPPSGTRHGQSGVRALPDQVTLELSERSKNMEDHFAARGRRVDLFGQATKADSPIMDVGHGSNQKLERPTEAIKAPDDDGISRPSVVNRFP